MSINLANRGEIKWFFEETLNQKPGLKIDTRWSSWIDEYIKISRVDVNWNTIKEKEFLDGSVWFEAGNGTILDLLIANREELNLTLNWLYDEDENKSLT